MRLPEGHEILSTLRKAGQLQEVELLITIVQCGCQRNMAQGVVGAHGQSHRTDIVIAPALINTQLRLVYETNQFISRACLSSA